jgi:hypothetical protein
MRSRTFTTWQAVIIFAVGAVLGGGVSGSVTTEGPASVEVAATNSIGGTCTSRSPAADFVCRNTWMVYTRHSHR